MGAPRIYWDGAPARVELLGRNVDLSFLNATLKKQIRVIALTGAGGLGKSTLARVWTGENVDDFETIAWVSFKDRPPLEGAYHEVRQLLTPI
jgi:ABC-type dipeptide/oligopeptide/nickel transport system ATPase subunit